MDKLLFTNGMAMKPNYTHMQHNTLKTIVLGSGFALALAMLSPAYAETQGYQNNTNHCSNTTTNHSTVCSQSNTPSTTALTSETSDSTFDETLSAE